MFECGFTFVVGPRAPAEDLQQLQPVHVLWVGGAESLNVGSLQKLSKDVSVR